MDEFKDKVALITGAGHDIGREIALGFATLGVAVAANDINPLNLDETVSQIRKAGGNAQPYVFDIAKRMPIEGMITQVLDHFKRIDILVNHASVQPDASVLEMDEWEFHRTLDVNLGGPFFTMQQVGRVMVQQGGGTIINLISATGHHAFLKGHAAHLASQAGLIGLTQAAASEFATHNIAVNAVCHGPNLMGVMPCASLDAAKIQAWREFHPHMRLGELPGLVSTVLYLCSKEASALNGQIITVDVG